MLRVIEHAGSGGNELALSSWVPGEVQRVVVKKWLGRAHSLEALLLAMRYELVQIPPDDEIERGLIETRYLKDYPVLCSAAFAGVDVLAIRDRGFGGVDVGKPAVPLRCPLRCHRRRCARHGDVGGRPESPRARQARRLLSKPYIGSPQSGPRPRRLPLRPQVALTCNSEKSETPVP